MCHFILKQLTKSICATCLVRLVKLLVARRHFTRKLSQHFWPGLADFSFAFTLANYISHFKNVLEVTFVEISFIIAFSLMNSP